MISWFVVIVWLTSKAVEPMLEILFFFRRTNTMYEHKVDSCENAQFIGNLLNFEYFQ